MKKIISIIVLAVLIQFIPYGKDHNNPQVKSEVKWDSKVTQELFSKACKNCHSNETKWPWYSNIAPISWLVTYNVNEARENMNISNIGYQKKNKLKDAAEELRDDEMPPFDYLLIHKEAKLSNEEKEQLIKGLENTFN